jgi:hypothetical protein
VLLYSSASSAFARGFLISVGESTDEDAEDAEEKRPHYLSS